MPENLARWGLLYLLYHFAQQKPTGIPIGIPTGRQARPTPCPYQALLGHGLNTDPCKRTLSLAAALPPFPGTVKRLALQSSQASSYPACPALALHLFFLFRPPLTSHLHLQFQLVSSHLFGLVLPFSPHSTSSHPRCCCTLCLFVVVAKTSFFARSCVLRHLSTQVLVPFSRPLERKLSSSSPPFLIHLRFIFLEDDHHRTSERISSGRILRSRSFAILPANSVALASFLSIARRPASQSTTLTRLTKPLPLLLRFV